MFLPVITMIIAEIKIFMRSGKNTGSTNETKNHNKPNPQYSGTTKTRAMKTISSLAKTKCDQRSFPDLVFATSFVFTADHF
jgi:hypothetical protein